jgi:type II secretion system protein N
VIGARSRRGAFSLSGPARTGIIALGCVLLTLFLIYRGFPYERLGESLARSLSLSTRSRVTIQELRPRLQLAGPGVEITGVHVITADGTRWSIDQARLRPAWSLSWLRLEPAFHTRIEVPGGLAEGILTLTEPAAWQGRLSEVDLARLPFASLWPGAAFSGTLEGRIDLHGSPSGPDGIVRLEATGGTLSLPGIDAAIPFDQLTAALKLGDDFLFRIQSLRIQSPLFSATVKGSVLRGRSIAEAAVDLQIQLTVQHVLRPAFKDAKIRVSPDGRATMRIGGTLVAPVIL